MLKTGVLEALEMQNASQNLGLCCTKNVIFNFFCQILPKKILGSRSAQWESSLQSRDFLNK